MIFKEISCIISLKIFRLDITIFRLIRLSLYLDIQVRRIQLAIAWVKDLVTLANVSDTVYLVNVSEIKVISTHKNGLLSKGCRIKTRKNKRRELDLSGPYVCNILCSMFMNYSILLLQSLYSVFIKIHTAQGLELYFIYIFFSN